MTSVADATASATSQPSFQLIERVTCFVMVAFVRNADLLACT
jgi:hypothetical protein